MNRKWADAGPGCSLKNGSLLCTCERFCVWVLKQCYVVRLNEFCTPCGFSVLSRRVLKGAEDGWAVRWSSWRRQLNKVLLFDIVLVAVLSLLLDFFNQLLCRKQQFLNIYYASLKGEFF